MPPTGDKIHMGGGVIIFNFPCKNKYYELYLYLDYSV